MRVIGQPWLMSGGPGRLLLVGRTPLCQSPPPDTFSFGIARGIVSTSGELIAGDGTEEMLACLGFSWYSYVYLHDSPAWHKAVGDGIGNVYSELSIAQSNNGTTYRVYANGDPVIEGHGTTPIGAELAPMGDGLVSAVWRSESTNSNTLRWQALPYGPQIVLDTIIGAGRYATCGDGRGGAFIAWDRGGLSDPSKLMRFAPLGVAAWTVPVSFTPYVYAIEPDSAGGAYVASFYASYDSTSLRHFDADGSTHAGWPTNGIAIQGPCPSIKTDGTGGVFLAIGCGPIPHKITRLLPSGVTAPGWQPGISVMGDYISVIDGSGGLYVLQSRDPANIGDKDIYAVHVLSDGTYAGSPVGELFVQAPGKDSIAAAIPDSAGGFYAAWTNGGSAYVGHYPADATTSTAFSIAWSRAAIDAIEVAWDVADHAFRGSIERSAAGGPWRVIADATADADGRVNMRDTNVEGGATYCYRLAATSGAAAGTEACVTARATPWITVVPGPVPTRGRLAWRLGTDTRVTVGVTLFDIAGRTVLRTRVPGGRGAIDVPRGAAAGIYLLELRQGGHALRTRIVLVD